jgi:hypothetical protein
MSAPRDKDDTTPGPPGITIEHMCDDVLQEELNVCIKHRMPQETKMTQHPVHQALPLNTCVMMSYKKSLMFISNRIILKLRKDETSPNLRQQINSMPSPYSSKNKFVNCRNMLPTTSSGRPPHLPRWHYW